MLSHIANPCKHVKKLFIDFGQRKPQKSPKCVVTVLTTVFEKEACTNSQHHLMLSGKFQNKGMGFPVLVHFFI